MNAENKILNHETSQFSREKESFKSVILTCFFRLIACPADRKHVFDLVNNVFFRTITNQFCSALLTAGKAYTLHYTVYKNAKNLFLTAHSLPLSEFIRATRSENKYSAT